MKRQRFTEWQILEILKDAESQVAAQQGLAQARD
jgi:hypothetical protein